MSFHNFDFSSNIDDFICRLVQSSNVKLHIWCGKVEYVFLESD